MNHENYFETVKGMGVLATADDQGRVNTAVYARPHNMGQGKLAFIMTERKTYANIQKNPHASYLFREEGDGFSGVRVTLKKTHVEDDPERIRKLLRRDYGEKDVGRLNLVHFEVEECLPLVS